MKHSIFHRFNLAWLVLSLIIFGVIQLLIQLDIIHAYYQITLITIGINIILAVSLNLIIGICGQFSLGHAGFMSIGAYTAAILTKSNPTIMGLLAGILLGSVIAAVVATLVALPTLRLKGDYLAIATLGFSEIIRIIVLNMDEVTNGAAGLGNIPVLTTWPVLFIAIVITIGIVVNFGRSAAGRACIAIREDEIAAEAMGINLTKYKSMAFIIGAMLASLAGSLFATYFYFIKPSDFGFAKSIDVLVIVVFGGIGSITGSVVSGVLLGLISIYLQSLAEIRMIIYALALVLIMIYRPQGLLGTKEFTMAGLAKWFHGKQKKEASR